MLLVFYPLGYPLLRFYAGYILAAALAFRLRFSYKARVFCYEDRVELLIDEIG